MANDNDSVDSNGNSTDLRPRRSNRSKGKPISQVEETDDNIVVNNVAYKVGDFAFYLDKKQDIYRIGLIEEFKFQKRDKLTNKKAEISLKQFYRLDEIPQSVLSNEGEFDTHVMPQNFPDWLRLREIFISDNTLSTPSSSLRGMCTVRHFPDLNHAMALFSTTQSANLNSSGSPRADHHSLINGKDGSIPVPKQRDDNTFFYVYSFNARSRKLAATYLEIRVGDAYQAKLPELLLPEEKVTDVNGNIRVWEQLMWKPNQIPEEVFNVYNMATISIACFSGFGGGVDDNASVENGRKIASHMLTRQKALDCLHKAQYNMEKAMEIFAENSLPETNKMPFLWTDEDHIMFDESVKIYGKNFLRINQDKRNKKSRLVGDFVTFYYYWKKNRPKNRKYATKKNLRSRVPIVPVSEQNENLDNPNHLKQDAPILASESDKPSEKQTDPNNPSPSETTVQEFCSNCKTTLPKIDQSEEKNAALTDRMRMMCVKCQHYLRRYGHQRPVETIKRKSSDIDDDVGDLEDEGLNGFDEEEDEEEQEGEEDEDEEVFTSMNSPSTTTTNKEIDDNPSKIPIQLVQTVPVDNKNTLAINKYDFDEEDENVEEVSSLLKRNQAKHSIMRDLDTKPQNYKTQANGSAIFNNKPAASGFSNNKSFTQKATNFSSPQSGSSNGTNSSNTSNQTTKPPTTKPSSVETQVKPIKRTSILKGKNSSENPKKRKIETVEDTAGNRSTNVTNRTVLLPANVSKQFHDSLKSNISHSQSNTFGKKIDQKKSVISGQTDVPSSQYDSNSSTSSSSSSSNDSSSSDEGDSLPLTKKSGTTVKFPPTAKIDVNKELKIDTSNKDVVDSSYSQMITAVPNLPGVCAVTNIGEPMPQMMQNISTDLSSTQSSSVPDLNIALVEPHFMKLSMPNPVVVTTSLTLPPSSNTISESIFPTPKPNTIHFSATNVNDLTKIVNFNSISSTQRIDNNPEETGLNLVKPKKRAENTFNEHNWAPPHESPSKLVHHRGDSSATESTVTESPKQIINGNEVVRSSHFGCIVRSIKSSEGHSCARTDLHHTTSGLKPEDIEKRQQYINAIKHEESSSTVNNSNIPNQDLSRQKLNSMPPPTEKVHHPSSVKHLTTPPLTHTHPNIPTSSVNQSSIPSAAHSRKIGSNPSHTLRSPSPAGNRSQASFTSGSSNMIRSNHMHNSPLMSSSTNNVLMNHMPNVPNNSLLMDYTNRNKVNEFLIYQAMAHSYEERQKQEMQKYLMSNIAPNLLNRAMWDQRDRFGLGGDAWLNAAIPPGSMAPPADLTAIMLALTQTQNANTQNRPRSAQGLNLSSISNPQSIGNINQNSIPGSSNQSNQNNADKPGSGRASVNHINNDFQRQNEALLENPELLEILRLMSEAQMNPNMAPILNMLNIQKSANSLHHQQAAPPSAHGLNNLQGAGAGANFSNIANQHLVQQSILSQIQAQSPSSAKPPTTSNFLGNGPRPMTADFYQYFQMNNFNRNQPR